VLRRDDDTLNCAMVGRRRVVLDRQSVARQARVLVAVEVRELEGAGSVRGVRTALSLASQIDPAWLREVHPDRVSSACAVTWNAESRSVEQVRQISYDGLVYEQVVLPDPEPTLAAPLLVARVRQGELTLEHWEHTVEQWLARTRCARAWFPEKGLIGYDPEDLELIIHEIVSGATRYSQIRSRPCLPAVQSALSWQDRQFVEQMAPSRLHLPGGHRLKLEYQPGQPARGRARIQDLYGLQQTPCVADGRQRVLLEILGPNHRPVQVTDDLPAFWGNTYPELKKELRRRYPRHEWR
jgi:ATP-dependent helicase HrpB